MDYLFKWKVGDIVRISTRDRTSYYVIYGTTEYDEDRKKYPSYLAKQFAYMTKSRKVVGYHTKAFQQKNRSFYDDEKWFEGMEYLWDPKKVDESSLDGALKKAYEAVLPDIRWKQDNYNRSQIKYIFNKR